MTALGSPTRKRARSMMCAPRSPSAPLPACCLSSRQIMREVGVGDPLLQIDGAEVVDLAQRAALDQVVGLADRGHEAVVEGDHVLDARLGHGIEHLSGFGGVARQRLLADDVLAGLRRRRWTARRACCSGRRCRTAAHRGRAASRANRCSSARSRSARRPRARPPRCARRSPPAGAWRAAGRSYRAASYRRWCGPCP